MRTFPLLRGPHSATERVGTHILSSVYIVFVSIAGIAEYVLLVSPSDLRQLRLTRKVKCLVWDNSVFQ